MEEDRHQLWRSYPFGWEFAFKGLDNLINGRRRAGGREFFWFALLSFLFTPSLLLRCTATSVLRQEIPCHWNPVPFNIFYFFFSPRFNERILRKICCK
jgi:hypothetical protein